jgi:neutral ceramidase
MQHGGWAQDSIATVIKIEKADGKLKGVFVNYGCHPSALDLHNLEFTEDWPYYTIRNIKEKVGEDVVVAYVQSAQGDAKVGYTAELSAVGADMNGIRSFWFAEKKGRILGKAVNEILDSIKTEGDLSVRTFYEKYPFPRRTSYPYTYAQALKWKAEADAQLAKMEKEVGITIGKRRLDDYRVQSWLANQAVNVSKQIESNKNPQPFMMAMQGLKIGENYFVTFPNEVFTEIGLAVKKASPHPNTIIVGLAAGYSGYIPTKAEYLEQGYASNGSPYAPECADLLVTNAAKIIEALDGN